MSHTSRGAKQEPQKTNKANKPEEEAPNTQHNKNKVDAEHHPEYDIKIDMCACVCVPVCGASPKQEPHLMPRHPTPPPPFPSHWTKRHFLKHTPPQNHFFTAQQPTPALAPPPRIVSSTVVITPPPVFPPIPHTNYCAQSKLFFDSTSQPSKTHTLLSQPSHLDHPHPPTHTPTFPQPIRRSRPLSTPPPLPKQERPRGVCVWAYLLPL